MPIDCIVISGGAEIDTSALTGESLPRSVTKGDELSSGCLVVNGFILCRTVRLAEESAAARILELVENANENKSQEERFITKFSRIYTPVVVLCALIMAIIPPLVFNNYTWIDSLYAALTFLVISCPCALVISVPLAFFGAIGGAASKGILFKGGNFVSSLAHADVVAFDKTGTLTEGRFSVLRVDTIAGGGEKLLFYAASAEYGSTHPLAEGIKNSATSSIKPTEYKELAGMGVVAKVSGDEVSVGNSKLFQKLGIDIPDEIGGELFVAINYEYHGRIFLTDVIKNEAESSLKYLRSLGIKRVAMLTGDRTANADRIAKELKIDDTHSELMPSDKYDLIIDYKKKSRAVVFVGDGINDAPTLAAADVGIAMGGVGSDSAIEAADVVIMTDDLNKIPTAIKIARKTLAIAKMNIVLAIGIKLAILLLGVLGFANMWLAVFADVGVAFIAILNSMRALRIKE